MEFNKYYIGKIIEKKDKYGIKLIIITGYDFYINKYIGTKLPFSNIEMIFKFNSIEIVTDEDVKKSNTIKEAIEEYTIKLKENYFLLEKYSNKIYERTNKLLLAKKSLNAAIKETENKMNNWKNVFKDAYDIYLHENLKAKKGMRRLEFKINKENLSEKINELENIFLNYKNEKNDLSYSLYELKKEKNELKNFIETLEKLY